MRMEDKEDFLHFQLLFVAQFFLNLSPLLNYVKFLIAIGSKFFFLSNLINRILKTREQYF